MLEFTSELQDFRLPILIPRRNKGHNEVLATISVKSSDLDNSEDLIKPLLSISKKVITVEILQELIGEICENFNIQTLTLKISFPYHLDRTSPTYSMSTFELDCGYEIRVVNRVLKIFMGVNIPIRITNVFPLNGRLTYFVEEPKKLFFEDLLDYVQKHTGIKLYPKVSFKENVELRELIDEGKPVKDYLDIISRISALKELGDGGYVKISSPDVYSAYLTENILTWSNSYIKYVTKAHKDAESWEESFIQRTSQDISDELGLSESLRADVVFIIYESIKEWKQNTNTLKETIRDHGKLVHKMIKEKAKQRLLAELKLHSKAV